MGIWLTCVFSLIILFCFSGDSKATALGDKAAQMQPGTWSEFTTNNFTTSLISTGNDYILNYSNSAVWDSIKREVRFVGQGHQAAEKMIIYKESTNSWANASSPGGGGLGHGYDHNAIDPKTGINYYKKYSNTSVYKYVNGSWSTITSMPGNMYTYTCCGSLEFFPEMNALIFSGGSVCFKFQGNAWTKLNTATLTMGGYHNVGEYSTSAKAVFFGGGNNSRDLNKLDSTGRITKMANAPVEIGVYNGNNSPLTADPVSGELLVLGVDTNMYAYNPAANQWRRLAVTYPFNGVNMTVTAPINTYGVVMVLKPGKVYLYKHDASGANVQNTALAPAGIEFSVWPNPFKGRTSVFARAAHAYLPLRITVTNMLGQPVMDFLQAGDKATLDAFALPAGIYHVEARTGHTRTGKMITLLK